MTSHRGRLDIRNLRRTRLLALVAFARFLYGPSVLRSTFRSSLPLQVPESALEHLKLKVGFGYPLGLVSGGSLRGESG